MRSRPVRRLGAAALVAVVSILALHPATVTAQGHGKSRRVRQARPAAPAPITVTSIELALDDAGEPGQVVEAFTPVDNPMHFIVRFDPAGEGTTFDVKLWAVRLDERDERDVVVGEASYVTKPHENIVEVKFELPQDWPKGTWKITVDVNGTRIAAREFLVVDRKTPKVLSTDAIAAT